MGSLGSSYKVHSEMHYQKQSGLSPNAFKIAMNVLSQAFAASETEPRTPSKRQRVKRDLDNDHILTSSPSSSKTPSSGGSTMSLKERAMAVQNGSAFGMASPTTPRRRLQRSDSTNSTPGKSALTPTRSSLRTPSSHSRDGQEDGGSPRSVRFSDHEDDPALTPRARISRSTSTTTAYEHPYTPSKRSRLGPGDTVSSKRTRDDVDDQEAEDLAINRLPTPKRSARKRQRAEEQIGFALFPLDDLYLSKMGITNSSDDQIDIHKWLSRWGSWLEQH